MIATIPEAIRESIHNTTHADPRVCPCRGGGWRLSDWDSWHKCPIHHRGQSHPEMDYPEAPYDVDPVDARPLAPSYVRRGWAEGMDRFGRAWWHKAIRVLHREGEGALAFWAWGWGLSNEDIDHAIDRIADWATD